MPVLSMKSLALGRANCDASAVVRRETGAEDAGEVSATNAEPPVLKVSDKTLEKPDPELESAEDVLAEALLAEAPDPVMEVISILIPNQNSV